MRSHNLKTGEESEPGSTWEILTNLRRYKIDALSVWGPYLEWIEALFTFSVGTWGAGDGVFRLVLAPEGVWKAYTIYTNLQSLAEYPEKRQKEFEFEGAEPYVVIIGAGQSGLDLGARLKFLDVPTLILEKNPRVGDQWRNRYQALCLHDPVWYDHFPYLPFPANWPVWTPAQKLADWLESYAKIMELNVWTSSTVTSAEKDASGVWVVNLTQILFDGTETKRVLRPTHLVFALGRFKPL
ncbi:FAD/NAD(P)-binding domain-containing protein [Thelephora ganbajun]|uniref:FAD/NAD(P)-binding domain-containing protein n=1 Tax=Thelephora ganbajun TaxID=370292 RepID=A0ACB6Z383_THEGA|nr:FAD/NAD(P)-binding domain-containing protein [Thelephora ganbajun]